MAAPHTLKDDKKEGSKGERKYRRILSL